MNRHWLVVILFPLAFVGFSGCAGGGGTTHNPPLHIVAGQTTPLELQVSIWGWGAGSGRLTSRYQDVTCHYRLVGARDFVALPMQPVGEFHEVRPKLREGLFRCVLPPFRISAKAVEYYFDFQFDRQHQARSSVTVPISDKAL